MNTRVAVAALGLLLATAPVIPAANDTPSLKVVLARAGDYVVRFERDLATLVAEEHYIQEVTGATTERRELRSDLLFISQLRAHRYVQFRDVFEVDGRPLRGRDQRLAQLAGNPAGASMEQIVTESARYNIGDIERTINVPLLPLMFLIPENQWRFRFSVPKGTRQPPAALKDLPPSPYFTVSTEVWVVEYKEVERPTVIRFVDRRGNIPVHGRFWIEPASGRVLMSELIAEDKVVHGVIAVSFQSEPVLDLLVPIEMRETYWRGDEPTRITGTASYSGFRRLR
jgi:hypothetical protein